MSLTNKDNFSIVGGTGFIGRSLTAKCVLSTRSVTCMGLSEQGRKHFPEDVEHLRVDITDQEALRQALGNRKFDYIFNLGGYIDHSPYLKGGRSIIESYFTGLMNIIEWELLC